MAISFIIFKETKSFKIENVIEINSFSRVLISCKFIFTNMLGEKDWAHLFYTN